MNERPKKRPRPKGKAKGHTSPPSVGVQLIQRTGLLPSFFVVFFLLGFAYTGSNLIESVSKFDCTKIVHFFLLGLSFQFDSRLLVWSAFC